MGPEAQVSVWPDHDYDGLFCSGLFCINLRVLFISKQPGLSFKQERIKNSPFAKNEALRMFENY